MKKIGQIVSLLLVSAMLLISTSCAGNGEDVSSVPTESASSTQTESVAEVAKGNYFSTDVWQPVPLVTKEAKAMGFAGGEGCQWMTYIAFDGTDGTTAYTCVDVGGLMKSSDGGKTWAQSTVGFKSEGSTGVTVDPTNKSRVLVVGAGSSQRSNHGLYLSTDEGVTWAPKCLLSVKGHRDFRRQIAFDVSSYDESFGGCKTIYWSTENIQNIEKGVYKSEDGGETWKLLAGSEDYAGCCIAVHPETGALYLSNELGLFKSTDGGATIVKTPLTATITYLATSKSAPNKIFLTSKNDFYVYDTTTDTATALETTGYHAANPTFLSVAPSDANKMVFQDNGLDIGRWSAQNFYTTDGGKTWKRSNNDYTGSFIPFNTRHNPSAFHPTDPNIVIKLGGDFIMRSEDGGANYKLSNDGNNAMCVGSDFNFNVNNPNLIAISSQDYNGGISSDGGKTWTYVNWSGQGWGGMTYGSYMINETSAVVGLSTEWYSQTNEVEIATTFDSGATINRTGILTKGSTIGMGVKGDDNIVFFADHRSTDGGHTWTKMDGCTGVFAASADGSKLFGINDYYVVMSTDKGETWIQMLTFGNKAADMAYNDTTGKLYVVCGGVFEVDTDTYKYVSLKSAPAKVNSIAIDPSNNDIFYVSCKDFDNFSADSAFRSIDGGETWTCINRSANDGREGPDGGRAASFVRVDGEGSAWFLCHCRGIWKMPRPDLG